MSTELFDMTKMSANSFWFCYYNTYIKALDTKMCLVHVALHVIYGQGTDVSFKLKKELIQPLEKMAEVLSSK